MPLKYPAQWKFEGFAHEIPVEAHREFSKLIELMVEGAERPKGIYEDFKSAYGVSSTSSNTSFAEGDMLDAMRRSMENAARYVASFYAGMESVKEHGIEVPSIRKLNQILADHDVPLMIEGGELVMKSGDIEFGIAVEEEPVVSRPFELGEQIGKGTFGAVHRITRKTKIGEYHFAMKLLAPSSFIENKDRARERFIKEMRVLERLQHRGIVTLLEAGLDSEGTPYILMPLIEGKDLDKALSGSPPLDVFNAFDEILRALEFAHGKGVVHRDLKPSNVLVREADQQPIILDFGCAFFLDEIDPTLTTQLIGTPGYVPEEVYENPKHRDVRQDIYACGVMLYQTIMRRIPRRSRYESVEETFEEYAGIDAVIEAAIAPEDHRTPTAKAMREQLSGLANRQ